MGTLIQKLHHESVSHPASLIKNASVYDICPGTTFRATDTPEILTSQQSQATYICMP